MRLTQKKMADLRNKVRQDIESGYLPIFDNGAISMTVSKFAKSLTGDPCVDLGSITDCSREVMYIAKSRMKTEEQAFNYIYTINKATIRAYETIGKHMMEVSSGTEV